MYPVSSIPQIRRISHLFSLKLRLRFLLCPLQESKRTRFNEVRQDNVVHLFGCHRGVRMGLNVSRRRHLKLNPNTLCSALYAVRAAVVIDVSALRGIAAARGIGGRSVRRQRCEMVDQKQSSAQREFRREGRHGWNCALRIRES